MDSSFWHQKWEKNDIAFHENEANPALVKYFNKLSLPKGSRVFIPLCGKTLDIGWLLSQGYHVAGAELSKLAIEQLFSDLKLKPQVSKDGEITHYKAHNIDIFVGDIFHLNAERLGHIDAIYDRAALVALPEVIRKNYTKHLIQISQKAPQLLLTYEYDQNVMEGPPFSVSDKEVAEHYQKTYQPKILASIELRGGLKGKCPAKENIWLLSD